MSAEQGEGPNFDLLDAVEYWEVPIEGGPPPNNPVPGANGARYSPPAAGAAAAAAPAAADADLFTDSNGGAFGGPVENGHVPPMVRIPLADFPSSLEGSFKALCSVLTALGCCIWRCMAAMEWKGSGVPEDSYLYHP